METSVVVSLVIGAVSITLAIVAMLHSTLSERRSTDNYIRTRDTLAEIAKQAAVIESTVSNTQNKLVETITEIAKPEQESMEMAMLKGLMPAMVSDPTILQQMITEARKQTESS